MKFIFFVTTASAIRFIDGLPDYQDAQAIVQEDDAFTQTEEEATQSEPQQDSE